MILNKRRRWSHSARVKLPLVRMSATLVFGVNTFDLDLWFQTVSVEQSIKRNSVGSGHVSQCWSSSFENHLDESFRCLQRCATETRLEKIVCLRVRSLHLTIDQHLGCSFQLVF